MLTEKQLQALEDLNDVSRSLDLLSRRVSKLTISLGFRSQQQKAGAPASTNKPQPEICPHFVSDKIQTGEHSFERVDMCTRHGKLSGVR